MSSRKLMLYIAQSLDGYIAAPDNDLSWLPQISEEDFGYEAFIAEVDTTLMGRVTFEEVSKMAPTFPYSGFKNIVFTSSPLDHKDVIAVSEHPVEYVRSLLAQEGKNIFLIGGGRLIAELAQANLIDEWQVFIVPVVLGTGKTMLSGMYKPTGLTLLETKAYRNGMVLLRYGKNTS